jgi:hypothetical protein
LQKLHILPSVFVNLEPEEKAFIIASINLRIEAEKKQAKEVERKSRKRS